MKQTLIEAPRRAILEYLKEKHHKEFPFPHVTELLYCLTKAYWDRNSPMQITDDEVLLFGIGHMLQEVMMPAQEVKGCCEEIYWSADQVSVVVADIPDGHFVATEDEIYPLQRIVGELKTTRMSSKREELPDSWYKQIMSYCYANDTNEAHLIVLHLMGNYSPPFPQLVVWGLEFTDEEIRSNWNWMLMRKNLLTKLIKLKRVPNPTAFAEPWECPLMSKKGMCRYELFCRARMEELKHNEEEKEDPWEWIYRHTTLDGESTPENP